MKNRATREFAVIDAETDPFRAGRLPWPFLWGYFDGERFTHWWGRGREADLCAYLARRPEQIVYAHNGGRFDFHYLIPWLDPDRELFLINGRIVRAFLRGGVEIRDSFALIPEPLSAYEKTKIDYGKMESQVRERFREEIVSYNRDDCVALFDLLEAFRAEHGDALTLPQAALRKWRSLSGEPRPRTSQAFDSLMRPYYFGGRCQSFACGIHNAPFEVYDINSAYPRAMMENHPIGTDRISLRTLPPDRLLPLSFVHLRARSAGALPLRGKLGDLSFPQSDDPSDYFATGHEIQAGLENRILRVDRVHSAQVFQQTVSFGPFIEHYWARRLEAKRTGNRLENLVSKRTMNGLYGKFAQNPAGRAEVRICTLADLPLFESQGFSLAGTFGPWLLVTKPKDDTWGYLNVATAASITGWVRATMARALHATEPLYCDTDSIAAPSFPIPQSDTLGGWKRETAADWGAFAGKKLYAWKLSEAVGGGWKTASKGARLPPEKIVEIARGNVVTWKNEAPTFRVGKSPAFLTRELRST